MSFETVRLRITTSNIAELNRVFCDVKNYALSGHIVSVEAKAENRTTAQNRILWSILRDLAHQVIWHGQKLQDEEWKDVLTASLKRQKAVPGIDGGFVILGQRTSRMTKSELADLIELAYAFGGQQEVKWSRTSLSREIPDEVAA